MRKSLIVFSILVLAAFRVMGQTAPAGAPANALTVIRAGALFDGSSDTVRKNQLIFIRGERIEKVAEASSAIPVHSLRGCIRQWKKFHVSTQTGAGRELCLPRSPV